MFTCIMLGPLIYALMVKIESFLEVESTFTGSHRKFSRFSSP